MRYTAGDADKSRQPAARNDRATACAARGGHRAARSSSIEVPYNPGDYGGILTHMRRMSREGPANSAAESSGAPALSMGPAQRPAGLRVMQGPRGGYGARL